MYFVPSQNTALLKIIFSILFSIWKMPFLILMVKTSLCWSSRADYWQGAMEGKKSGEHMRLMQQST
jgi:pimeloyl-CoA synthetase